MCPWPLAPLTDSRPEQLDDLLEQLAPWSWNFNDAHIDFEQVAYLRERNVASLVYTVNDTERASYLRDNGVTGVITDYPTRMLAEL